MIKTINSTMFQSEMENLELGLNLGPSDLLFSDELLNISPEKVPDTFGFADEDDVDHAAKGKPKNSSASNDILERIIQEVKLPFEEDDGQSIWDSPLTLFEDADCNPTVEKNYDPNSPGSESNSSGSSVYSADDTQALIEEMEQFLSQHEEVEKPKAVAEEHHDEDSKRAEEILDALISGKINTSNEDSGFFDDSNLSEDLSNHKISNISEIVTDDGKQIMIVITNDEENDSDAPLSNMSSATLSPSSSASSFTQSPGSYSMDDEHDFSSDPDWSPSPVSTHLEVPRRATKRSRSPDNNSSIEKAKKGTRGPYKKKGRYDVKDRKERKKLQNVVAARRYRDKKKSEQQVLEQEEQELLDKNNMLKSKLSDIEGEVKTLKNLMLELGLVKVNA